MPTRNVPVADAGPTAEDVMLRDPRTLGPEATVAEARSAFENPKERIVLVADGENLVGAIRRDDVGEDRAADAPLGALADAAVARVAPGEPVARVLELLDADHAERLPVVTDDGALVGLVCFNRARGVFCVDAG
jgi:CBS domain-containing protein